MKESNRNPVSGNEGHLPDETIIDLYWDRDETAIKETDRKYGKYLYAIAYNIVHDNMDCEECLNDTYLGTWNKIPPARPSMFQVFLSRIMRNIAVDKYRHNTASKRIPSEMTVSLEELDCLPEEMSVEEEYAIEQVSKALNAYLRTLENRQVFAFVCRYYYADRISTIAKLMDVSENTVYRDLAEIRDGFKAILDKEGITLG